jgi:hypothetical protein
VDREGAAGQQLPASLEQDCGGKQLTPVSAAVHGMQLLQFSPASAAVIEYAAE